MAPTSGGITDCSNWISVPNLLGSLESRRAPEGDLQSAQRQKVNPGTSTLPPTARNGHVIDAIMVFSWKFNSFAFVMCTDWNFCTAISRESGLSFKRKKKNFSTQRTLVQYTHNFWLVDYRGFIFFFPPLSSLRQWHKVDFKMNPSYAKLSCTFIET